MVYLIFILVTLALLVGFVALSDYETRRGARVFARERARLDGHIERAEFILAHVNLAAFLREECRLIAHAVAHAVAHVSLTAVRAVERFLTRLIRRFHMEHTVDASPRGNAREFVKTLSDFKDQLKETPPEIPDIY